MCGIGLAAVAEEEEVSVLSGGRCVAAERARTARDEGNLMRAYRAQDPPLTANRSPLRSEGWSSSFTAFGMSRDCGHAAPSIIAAV